MRLQDFASDEELREINHLLPFEYLLVLQPHEALWNEIKFIKEKFADLSKSGMPHLRREGNTEKDRQTGALELLLP